MKCDQSIDSLTAFLHHELSPDEQGELQAHLSVCTSCQHEFEANRAIKRFLRHAVPVEPSAEFRRNLEHRIECGFDRTSTRPEPMRPGHARSDQPYRSTTPKQSGSRLLELKPENIQKPSGEALARPAPPLAPLPPPAKLPQPAPAPATPAQGPLKPASGLFSIRMPGAPIAALETSTHRAWQRWSIKVLLAMIVLAMLGAATLIYFPSVALPIRPPDPATDVKVHIEKTQ